MFDSKEEYQDYLRLKNKDFNNQLKEAITDGKYDKIKQLIFDNKLKLIIDDEVYNLLLERPDVFCYMLKDENLNGMCVTAIKHVPVNGLTYKSRGQGSSRDTGAITDKPVDHMFKYKQGTIPNLLKAISDSGRDDFFIAESCISRIKEYKENLEKTGRTGVMDHARYYESRSLQDYYNAEKAIAQYCTKNNNGDYNIEPHYLLPIKDSPCFKEVKQCFKDVYSAINSNDHGKAESSLKKIKENVFKHSMGVSSVSEVLTMLAKEVKSNGAIKHAVSDLQKSITPTALEDASILQAQEKILVL